MNIKFNKSNVKNQTTKYTLLPVFKCFIHLKYFKIARIIIMRCKKLIIQIIICSFIIGVPVQIGLINFGMLLLLSTPLHQRAASRVQHPNHVAANSLSPQVARKGSTLSGFVQRSWLEREVGRDLHSNKWEEV